jgi:DNA-binding transcriptional regulator GbsR (MarR family)
MSDNGGSAHAEQMAGVLTSSGFPRMPARLLMALMASDDGAMTGQELRDALGISASAVSGAVQYLQTLHLVRRVALPGTRRERYELPDDPWYVATADVGGVYSALIRQSEAWLRDLDDLDSPVARRVSEMIEFFTMMRERMPELVAEWKARSTAVDSSVQ